MTIKPFDPLHIDNLARSVERELLAVEPQPMNTMIARTPHFKGAGIYALYYTGDFDLYAPVALKNQDGFNQPIYVGKAVPEGGRKGVTIGNELETKSMSERLRQHATSIREADNLEIDDFYARWLPVSWVWIPLGESAVIRRTLPLWNTVVDGFGSKAAGKGRFAGQRSRWDTLHPGRRHAIPLQERSTETLDDIRTDIERVFQASSEEELEEMLGDALEDADF